MGEKLVVGPINKGIATNRTPFVIDNDSFPVLQNAYQWRGRIKRKRGTSFLGRLQRSLTFSSSFTRSGWVNLFGIIGISPKSIFITNITKATNAVVTYQVIAGPTYQIGQDVYIAAVEGMTQINGGYYSIIATTPPSSGTATMTLNLNSLSFSSYTTGGVLALVSDASIIPSTISVVVGSNTYTEPATPNGTLVGSPTGSGQIHYNAGVINVLGAGTSAFSVTFSYYVGLPVMGLEDLILGINQYPGTLAFDTTYSYNISTSSPYTITDVSFYKNPANGTYPSYVQNGSATPTTWNGQDYQQFWTVNYQGALWATNGIQITNGLFDVSSIGMQFKPITSVTVLTTTTASLAITAHGLVVGDFVFINEVATTTGINFQTGYVITVTNANAVVVKFPYATLTTSGTGGIAQYLTNRSNTTLDCLRWYDGSPSSNNGWVNFMPPLSQNIYSIADLPAAQYYLVGARMILPFKDRLIFIGPVVQSSSTGPFYLQDTVVYSQNGTPYYTTSYTNSPSATVDTPTNPAVSPPGFVPILVPINQTATPSAYFEDSTGFGGFVTAGLDQPITTVGANEDVLIMGLTSIQIRFVYTGNDVLPFNFFIVNSELGSGSTFSSVVMDQGVLSRGNRGYIITSQTQAQRIDLDLPDQVYQISLTNNGAERICAQRDFINEWVYFTYSDNEETVIYPNQTLQYNYRDNSWAIFNEVYTTYGTFREAAGGSTWADIGTKFPSWSTWNQPWNSGSTTVLQQQVIAGNHQGFIVFRDEGTGESPSLSVQNITNSVVTSPNHSLNEGDYITITGAFGTVAPYVNGQVFSVQIVDENSFLLDPQVPIGLTYVTGATITRMYIPYIQTKQFPAAWELGRKTRIGPQQYLLSTTNNNQITLLIFLSQNSESAYNSGDIVPNENAVNDSLIYSTVLYTCPESINLGLTPANTNLQMVTAIQQAQIWHRINTSLIGDTVQLGFTMSDSQMRDPTLSNQFAEIEIHGFIIDISPSMLLS